MRYRKLCTASLCSTFGLTVRSALLFVCATLSTSVRAETAYFRDLGPWQGETIGLSGTEVSDDGSVVAGSGSRRKDGVLLGSGMFRWDRVSGWTSLAFDPSYRPSGSSALSGDGTRVAASFIHTANGTDHSGFWDRDGAFIEISGNLGSVSSASEDGSVIIVLNARWTAATGLVSLLRPGQFGLGEGVSADGEIVTGTFTGATIRGFLWDEANGARALAGALPGQAAQSSAHSISPNGRFVVGHLASAPNNVPYEEAFFWSPESQYHALGYLPGYQSSQARAVDDQGTVVGYSSLSVGSLAGAEPFIWDSTHGMRNLVNVLETDYGLAGQLDGLDLIGATDITPDGRYIVGSANNARGERTTWIAHLGTPPGESAQVVGRHLFYNNSKFDGRDVLPNPSDDAAIGADKTALLPGQDSTFANYSSYAGGINGVVLDVANLSGTPTTADFTFKVGNSSDVTGWKEAPAPESVSVRPGEGADGSDRVTIIWADRAIRNQWLEISVLPSQSTGLLAADTFYFGNAVGESGNVIGDYSVSITDELLARNNPVSINPGALVTNRFDYNRDAGYACFAHWRKTRLSVC